MERQEIKIKWPIKKNIILSNRDKMNSNFNENKNILVCGTGSIGKRHLLNLFNIGEKVISWSYRSNKILSLKKNYKIKSITNLDEALSKSRAVIIATPTDNHLDIAIKALKRGKSILIEKPISNSKKNIKKLITLQKNQIIELGHQLRMHPTLIFLKKKLSKLTPHSVMGYRFVMGQNLIEWRKLIIKKVIVQIKREVVVHCSI